jgi:molecular chaperone HscA
MLRDSYEHARDDMHARALQEHRVEGERLAAAVRAAMRADSAMLEPGESAEIERLLAALQAVLGGSDHRAIKQASDALNRATEPFAARRMDASVRQALTGKRIASLDA